MPIPNTRSFSPSLAFSHRALRGQTVVLLTLTVMLFMLPFTIRAAPADAPTTPAATAADPIEERKTLLLDDFKDLSGWSAVTSAGARLEIAQDIGRNGGRAMRLDFEASTAPVGSSPARPSSGACPTITFSMPSYEAKRRPWILNSSWWTPNKMSGGTNNANRPLPATGNP
ncbi:MAG: hypothetical protein IPM75_16760 [Candidatus Competibacteraceae bacterium]|nr:hypothetical protein [Candidatus Competibacteraceae bacterium]